MQETIYMPDADKRTRKQMLIDNCVSSEETTFQKQLSEDEVQNRREKFTDNAIQLNKLDEELSVIQGQFKAKTKPLKEDNGTLLTEIKTRQTTAKGTLYNLQNFENGMLETFDETGELIRSRKMRPDEKQGRLYIAEAK